MIDGDGSKLGELDASADGAIERAEVGGICRLNCDFEIAAERNRSHENGRNKKGGLRPLDFQGYQLTYRSFIALHERSFGGAAAKRRAALKGQEISNTLAVGGLLLALGLLIAFAASDD